MANPWETERSPDHQLGNDADTPPVPGPVDDPAEEATIAGSAVDNRLNPPDSQAVVRQGRSSPSRSRFGDFELIEEVSRGGMGVVYRARELQLNRIVALKMILAGELAGEEDVKRFRAEAEAAAQLEHPGIVPIHEIGSVGGQHYYTMSFIDGAGLDQFKGSGVRDPKSAARIVQQVAEAVDYAHTRGIVHRDLKPANVLMDAEGIPRITDFGLAKRTDASGELTRTGQILGTPGYMAPEQAAGESKFIGAAADIYALGALLYFLITGRPPFQSANVIDTLVQSLESEPTMPRNLNSSVPRPLEQICMRCLERDPADRYTSAAEVAQELNRFLQGEPVQARPPTATERVRRFARRSPALTVHLVALALLILVAQLRYLLAETDPWLHAKVMGSLFLWLGFSVLSHVVSSNDRSERIAGTVLLCVDAAMITVLLALMCEPGSPPGPLLIGYPLMVVAGALYFHVNRVVIVTIASVVSYLSLLVAEPYLVEPIHYHVCFLIMLLAIAGCLLHQVRRVRTLSDYFQSPRG
jgi:serine/threonine-protein kinase